MTPNDFVALFRTARASAILRTNSTDAGRKAMEAAVRAGFVVCEFTLTTPGAMGLIREFASKPGIVVGAGTVLTVEEAREAVAAGARFLVSPVVDEAVIDEAKRLNVAAMPGCSTPTEMLRAYRAGAQLQKLFPAPGIGAAWVSQTLGPLPFLNIVPTAGVTAENVSGYLKAGAFAVGFVNTLFDPGDIAAGRFDAIEARGRAMQQAVQGL
jgi:Entner-Doudoroff aldolase